MKTITMDEALKQVDEAFPGKFSKQVWQERMINDKGEMQSEAFNWRIVINGQWFFGKTFDDVFQKVKTGYTPEKAARAAYAKKLRDEASRIENGDLPFPPPEEPALPPAEAKPTQQANANETNN